MEEGLGCISKQTATEQKEAFNTILRNAIGNDDEKSDHFFMEIQENLNNMVDEHETVNNKNAEPIILTNDTISDILIESGIPEEITAKIEKSYTEEFGDTPPVVDSLIDKKTLAANEQRKKEQRLEKKVQILEERLEKTKQDAVLDSEKESALESETELTLERETDTILETDLDTNLEQVSDSKIKTEEHTSTNYDIVLQVKPQKVAQIKSQIIDGQKYIVIPIDDNEQTNVNGVTTLL